MLHVFRETRSVALKAGYKPRTFGSRGDAVKVYLFDKDVLYFGEKTCIRTLIDFFAVPAHQEPIANVAFICDERFQHCCDSDFGDKYGFIQILQGLVEPTLPVSEYAQELEDDQSDDDGQGYLSIPYDTFWGCAGLEKGYIIVRSALYEIPQDQMPVTTSFRAATTNGLGLLQMGSHLEH